MDDIKVYKQIFSIIGAIATHAVTGSIFFYWSFYPYLYSFLKRSITDLTNDSMNYIMPVTFTLMFLSFWIGAFLERKTHPRVAVFIGHLFVVSAVGGLLISKSLILEYIIFGLYGIGIGINYLASIRCLFYLFPEGNHHGLIVGVSMAGFALSSALCLLVNILINPDNVRASINFHGDGERIYPIFITDRIDFFMLIYLAVIGGLSVISILCLCSYSTDTIESRSSFRYTAVSHNSDIPLKRNIGLSLNTALRSDMHSDFKNIKTYCIMLIGILINFFSFFCIFTYFNLGKKNDVDDLILYYCPFGFILLGGIGRVIFGILYDKLRFKTCMYVIAGLQVLLSLLYYFSLDWSWAYCIIVSLVGFTYGGFSVILPVYVFQYYSSSRGIEIYAIIAIGKAFSAILSFGLYEILAMFIHNRLVLIMGIIGGACNLVSVLFVIFGTDELEEVL